MPLNDQQIQTLGRDALQRAAAGDFVSAEEMFARIVEARPNMGQALHLLGQIRLKLGRFAEADEVAGVVTLLLSPKAGAVTGSDVVVDAGTLKQA